MTSDINLRPSSTNDVTRPCELNNGSNPDDHVPWPKHTVESPSSVDKEKVEDFFSSCTKGVHAKSQIIEPDERDPAPNPDHVGADDTARKSPSRIAKPSSYQVLNMADVAQLDLPRVHKADKAGQRVATEPPAVTCRNRLAIYMDIEFADQVLKLEGEYLLKQAELVSKWEDAMEVALGRVTELGRSRAVEVRDKLLAFEVKKEGGLQFKQLLEEVCKVREQLQPVSPMLDKLQGHRDNG